MTAIRILFVVAVGVGAVASSSALAQTSEVHEEPATRFLDIPPRLYREPLTRADTTPEWLALSKLVGFGLSEDDRPGSGVNLTTQRYGLAKSEATAFSKLRAK